MYKASAHTLAAALLLVAACGGGGDGVSDPPRPPTISGLQVAPTAVYVNDGGGQTDIVGTLDYSDADGDVDTLTLEVFDESGASVVREVAPVAGAGGMPSGTIQGSVTISTTEAAMLTFSVFVTDRAGLRSNRLEGEFRIAEFPWVTKAAMPTPRLEYATASVNGLVYVIGGRDALSGTSPKPTVSTLEVYDPATDSWSAGASMPLASAGHAAATLGGKVYIFGGDGPFNQPTDTVLEYDPATDDWSLRTPMPEALTFAAIAVQSDRIYLAGGRSGGQSSAALLIYDPATDSWDAGTPIAQAREGAVAASFDGQILVYGGRNSTHVPDGGYLRSLVAYDPVMDTWSELADGAPRRDAGFALQSGLIYAVGGNNVSRSLAVVSAYDPATDAWLSKTSLPTGIAFAQAEAIDDAILVFDTNETLEYTPANDIE